MICPRCASHIPDGSVVCPACRVNLEMVETNFEVTGAYCGSCGALVPPGELHCPACGMPVAAKHAPKPRRSMVDPPELDDIDEPEDVESSSEQTNAMARIRSALPLESESVTRKAERMPAARTTLVAMLAALAMVGGITLLITHPWDPNAFQAPPREGVDMSQAGSTEQIESLVGQDSDPDAPQEIVSGDDATYAELVEAYAKLADFAASLDQSNDLFETSAIQMEQQERADAYAAATQLGLDISNFISELDEVDVTSGTYASDLENMLTLANYLRNRSDALTEGWKRAAESQSPNEDSAYIKSPVRNSQNPSGVDAYKALFDKNYESWRPVKR